MAIEWPKMTLREGNVMLIDCDHRTPPPAETGYPYIAIPQLRNGRINAADARRITQENYLEWTRKAKPRAHDVVLSRRCNPGETGVASPDLEFALGQNLVLLRSDGTKVYAPFLRWLVRGPEWWEQIGKFINVGAVFDSLKCADIPNFELHIPPLSAQRAISRILGALDDRIELSGRMTDTLGAIARALFRSWLVEFDPIRLSSEGRVQEVPENVRNLFPDSFQDSELGEIPAGWKVLSLDGIAHFLNGLALQKYPPTGNESLPVIKIAQLRPGTTDGADRASADLERSYIVDDGDVLFSWSGSLECVIWTGGRGALNQHLFKVTSSEYPKWFYYFWIHEHLEGFRRIAAGKATTMGHIQRHHLAEAKVVIPGEEVIRKMNQFFAPMLDRIVHQQVQSRTLSELRDTLLPKLLSGGMHVHESPRLAEATA
ncbi:MAG: restriction endonuclease subunit S [Betaproteobacteria bacterium]